MINFNRRFPHAISNSKNILLRKFCDRFMTAFLKLQESEQINKYYTYVYYVRITPFIVWLTSYEQMNVRITRFLNYLHQAILFVSLYFSRQSLKMNLELLHYYSDVTYRRNETTSVL